MSTAAQQSEPLPRRLLVLMSLGLALIGATGGLALGQAFANTINCSHQWSACNGTGGPDDMYGWENINEMNPREGRDNAWAYGQQDWMWGGNDADALFGGEGADHVFGTDGNDSYFAVPGGAGFGVFGNSQGDQVDGNTGSDIVEGDQGNDNMAGGDNDDWLFSEDGETDVVQGGAGPYDACWVDGYDAWGGCAYIY